MANDLPERPDLETERMVDRVVSSFLHTDYRFNFLEAIAVDALGNVQLFVEELQEFLRALEMDDIPGIDDVEDIEVPDLDYSDRPQLGQLDLDFKIPDFNRNLVLKSFDEIDDMMDKLSFELPAIGSPDVNLPRVPTLAPLSTVPQDPSVSMPDVPPAPTHITVPEAPEIKDFGVIDFPEVSLPEFDLEFIPDVIAQPGEFSWEVPVYTSDIYSDILENLLRGLRYGGTGLTPEVEQAIFENHLRRIHEENEARIEEAEGYFAGRGFTMPSGMLAYKMSRISREAMASKEQASREIMIAQAELAQKNTHFIMERGLQLEGLMRQFFIDNANMSLSGQKAAVEHTLSIHKAMVEQSRMRIEQWRAQYEVWKAKVENAKLPFEEAKLKLEIAQGNAEIQKLHVDIYRGRLDGMRAGLDLYKGQLEAVRVAAEIEGLKVQIFESQIKAWLARIEANTQQVNLYKAQLDGEKTKVDIFTAEVNAHNQILEAQKKQLEKLIARQNSLIEENKLRAQEFSLYMDKYKAEMDVESKIVGAKVEGFKAEAAAYNAETEREKAHFGLKVAQTDAKIKVAGYQLQAALSKLEASVRGFEAIKKIKLEGLSGVMNVGAQLAASAIQGINTNTSISYSGGDSFGWSKSYSEQKIVSAQA